MKTILPIILTALVSIVATYCITLKEVNKKYEYYIHTSEELLWEIEEMNEYHNIDWGDTVCEGINWDEYCNARESLGLDYLVYWGEKGE